MSPAYRRLHSVRNIYVANEADTDQAFEQSGSTRHTLTSEDSDWPQFDDPMEDIIYHPEVLDYSRSFSQAGMRNRQDSNPFQISQIRSAASSPARAPELIDSAGTRPEQTVLTARSPGWPIQFIDLSGTQQTTSTTHGPGGALEIIDLTGCAQTRSTAASTTHITPVHDFEDLMDISPPPATSERPIRSGRQEVNYDVSTKTGFRQTSVLRQGLLPSTRPENKRGRRRRGQSPVNDLLKEEPEGDPDERPRKARRSC